MTQIDLMPKAGRLDCHVKAAGSEDGRTRFEFVASTEATDRDGEVIEVAGWEWRYPLPKLLYGHSSATVENVLGKVESLSKEGGQLVGVGSINDAASLMHRAAGILVSSGDLDTLSVGFEPLAWRNADGSEHTRTPGSEWPWPEKGRRYIKQELLELSLVGVPSNYEAIVTGIKALQSHKAPVLERNSNPLDEWEEQAIADFIKALATTEWKVRLGLKFAEALDEERAVSTMDAAHRIAAVLRQLNESAKRAE
jgi:phage head maturation protease